ncbi:hypothetical protein ALC60_10805 [Trachymyrmex zeteki]|uniref:Uncharacterized protein n=1 Tax=Mycetomoellerius zeteki TaxID=64791 RepID=A0A151WQD2_9HYME|nr:hypothetical protein ALC60_10805 [Trachymyrmex zeteki]
MPENVRSLLTISELADLSKLVLQADRIADVTRNTVAVVSANNPKAHDKTSKEGTDIQKLKKIVESLTREVKRNTQRSRSKLRERGRSKEWKANVCYYHDRFGEQAKNCRSPCTFKKPKAKPETIEN